MTIYIFSLFFEYILFQEKKETSLVLFGSTELKSEGCGLSSVDRLYPLKPKKPV